MCQILRRLGLSVLFEIGWRRDGGHLDFRSDPHCNHVAGNALPHSDAGVEALADNVAQGVVDDEVYLDVRVFAEEGSKRGPQDRFRSMIDRSEADRPGWLVPELRQSG